MDRIQLRRDSSARWAEINPILLEGEVGYEIDTKLRKIGDGVNRWNDLEYLKAEGISQETGNSQNLTMSQDAITREFFELSSEVYSNIFNIIVEYSSAAPNNTLRFNADIKEGGRYIAKVSYDSPVSSLQMGSSDLNTGGYIDSTDVLSKISEYTFEFVASADANSFVVYSIGATKMDFILFEDEAINKKVDGIEKSLNKEIKRTDNINKEMKMDYTFAYNPSNRPTITKKEDESYDVVFMASTYYIIHYGFGSINNFKLESKTTYHVEVGQMLVYNINNNVLEVVSAAINDGVKRLVLLRNYDLVIGEFESIIADEAKKQSVSNKTDIESIKSDLHTSTTLVAYNSTALRGAMQFSTDIKTGRKYIAKVIYDREVATFQMGSVNTDKSGYIDSTEILSGVSEYTFKFTASADANAFTVYTIGATTMDFTLAEIVGVKEINDKTQKLSRISVASEEYFQVPCNAQKSVSEKSFIESVDGGYILPTNKIYKDWCHFVMPNADAPLKLVILCHGSGLTVKENVDQWYNYQNIGKILISMGYAVLCCNFMPIDVGEAFYGSPLGNWMIPQIAKGAYDYVVNKYNIDTNGCFIYGQSNGGLTAENIVELTDIPINAYALEVPNLSFQWGQMLVNPNPMRLFYGMSTSAKTPSTYEADKCVGLDPFTRNMKPPLIMSGDTLEEVNAFDWQSVQSCKFRKNIPILIQQSLYDNIVSHAMISAYARAIQNGGGYVKVITYDDPNVQHYIAEQTSKVGTIGIYNVRAAMYNNLSFFADFGGEKIEKVNLI